MANKRRPKKARAPYRRYVYRLSFTAEPNLSDDDGEESLGQTGDGDGHSVDRDIYGNKMRDFRAHAHIISTYVLTQRHSEASTSHRGNATIWPRSQFSKVDVLQYALKGPQVEAAIADPKSALEDLVQPSLGYDTPCAPHLMRLPAEIIAHVLEVLYARGKLKPRFLRVCRLFYAIAFPLIYRAPYLKARNFFAFVELVSANRYAGECIKELDMLGVVQSGKNAFVLKLLKRTKAQLEVFVAPQASFGLAPLLSLKNCAQLTVLDLRLVSETLDLSELFVLIRALQNLTHLSFPRSLVAIREYASVEWPPRLSSLRLLGGISDDFLLETNFPETITHLEFAHCPAIKEFGFQQLVRKLGHNLKTLKVQYPMPGLRESLLDPVFNFCPKLVVLEVLVDYVLSSFFDEENLSSVPYSRPLKTLYIESSGMLGTSTRLDPIDLAVAINDERLPNLKNIRCTAKLGWDPKSEYVGFIVDALDERGGGLYIGY